MKDLKTLLEAITPELSKDDLDKQFPQIAEYILRNYGIKTKGRIYLINEIEFYYFDPLYDDKRVGNGKSRITYERTAPAGSWFIHDYGVDLTFNSDSKKGFGGGILIRSIEESQTSQPVTGPVNCVNELWNETIDAFSPIAPNPMMIRVAEREIELNADTRLVVDKVDKWKSNWRFTVKGKKVCR